MNANLPSLIVTLLVCSVLGAKADPLLDFNFSFTNTDGNVPGMVTGELIGLQNNASSRPSDILITSIPASIGITAPPSYSLAAHGWFSSTSGSFTVVDGQIASSDYLSYGSNYYINMGFYSNTISNFSVTRKYLNNGGGPAGVTFSPQAVPEPGVPGLLAIAGALLITYAISKAKA